VFAQASKPIVDSTLGPARKFICGSILAEVKASMPYPFLLSYSRKDAKKIEGNTERPDPYFEAFLDRRNQRAMHFTGSTGFVCGASPRRFQTLNTGMPT
jgi:hypothetical protein